MFENILSDSQKRLSLKLLPELPEDFYLSGGTAMALLIGHRKSIDFDLATVLSITPIFIDRLIMKLGLEVQSVLVSSSDEYSIIIDGVKITFYNYPFQIAGEKIWQGPGIKIPDILSLAAMKAYALGRRSKWKDYVDLYFCFKSGIKIFDVVKTAEKIFLKNFNEKLFREQLCYFDDVDFSEQIDFMSQFVDDDIIKSFLEKVSVQDL